MGTRSVVERLLEELKDCKDIHDVNIAAGELWVEATKPRIAPILALIVTSVILLASVVAGAIGFSHGPMWYTGHTLRSVL